VVIGPAVDLHWLYCRSASGPSVAVGPTVDLQWL